MHVSDVLQMRGYLRNESGRGDGDEMTGFKSWPKTRVCDELPGRVDRARIMLLKRSTPSENGLFLKAS